MTPACFQTEKNMGEGDYRAQPPKDIRKKFSGHGDGACKFSDRRLEKL
jgi:hypothetical protein